jgi:hypothetical protein
MTARQKIESLTNSWYGFYLVGALFSLFTNGFGIFSMLGTVIGTLFSILLTFFLGRRLLAKSSIWRFILLCWSGISTITGTLGVGRNVLAFFSEWSFSLLVQAVALGVLVFMHIRSFTTLSDKSVKAYFN